MNYSYSPLSHNFLEFFLSQLLFRGQSLQGLSADFLCRQARMMLRSAKAKAVATTIPTIIYCQLSLIVIWV